MANRESRTRIVCLHEGEKGRSIDPVFIRELIKKLGPNWIRPWNGNNAIRAVDKGGRSQLINVLPAEIKIKRAVDSSITIMVWADLDHDMADGDALRRKFWEVSQNEGVTQEEFDSVIFVFAKDRLENWIEYLNSGNTDESKEGARIQHNKDAATAARHLAKLCKQNKLIPGMPPSLVWSCKNWRTLIETMQ